MTASAAKIGYDTRFSVETAVGSGIYVEMGEVTNLTAPNFQVDQIEVTHMQSPNRTKEFIAGLGDPGSMTIDLNHIPSSATDDFIIAWRAAGETRSCRITWPGGAVTDTFGGFVQGYEPTPGGPNVKMSSKLTVRVAGAVTRAG
jgi:hypothetical protein